MFFFNEDRARARRIEETVNLSKLQLRTIMTKLETLHAKLDEAKQAAADERTEVLAALEAIRTAPDLDTAIAKADEVIASIKGVHGEADDA